MSRRMLFASTALLAGQALAENFALYPTVNSDKLAQAFNISIDCLEALNTTLPCDQTLLSMAGSVDNYWWEADNVTQLCTRDCYIATHDWNIDVQNKCAGDTLVAFNKIIPADSVTGRYHDGLQIACLTNGNSSKVDEEHAWCLIESQEWVGSDVVRPDCSANPSDPSCSDPTDVGAENQRIANLYGNDVLCSECFIQMMYHRLSSAYLPNQDYSNYLVSQYQDILDVCNYADEMPELVIQAPPNYATAVPPPLNLSSYATTGCNGQTTLKSTLSPNANCDTIAQAFNVATGAVQAATNDANCVVSSSSICLPSACTLQRVPTGATCESLVKAFSSDNLTVSTIQFLNWNPSVNGVCENLLAGDYVCSTAPGGLYVPPPASPDSGNSSSHTRGGGDGSSAGNSTDSNTTTTATTSTTTGSPVPSPTQSGIIKGCIKYAKPQSGDSCEQFASDNKITPTQLYTWNAILGSKGENCATKFFLEDYYCVAGPSSTSTTSTTTQSAIPSPTQSGIVDGCTKYAQPQSGNGCEQFAANNNITPTQLYTWNTILGSKGENCATQFFLEDYYCVAGPAVSSPTPAKSTATSPTTTESAIPRPTQAGITSNCNKYAMSVSGEYCEVFAQKYNIATNDLYKWNTVLGSGGENCDTQFFLGYYYCIGVSA